jgi:O-antigen/teichoic acid export membrane protein
MSTSAAIGAPRMRMVPATTLSFAVQIVGGAISALTNLYLARKLGPANKGAAQVLVTVPAILIVVSNFGVHVAGAWFIGRDRYRLDQVLSAVLWWAVAISAALAVPLVLLREPIRVIVFGGVDAKLVTVSLGCIPLYLIAYYAGDVLLASGRLVLYAILRLLPLVTYGVAALVLVGQRGLGLLGATLAFSGGIAASGVFALAVMIVLSRGRLAPHGEVMKGALKFGGFVHVGTVAQFLVFRVDVLIVNALSGSAAAGLYAVAASLAEIVWYVGRSVESVILPRIARADAREAPQISTTALRVTVAGSTAAAVGIAIVASPLLHALLPAFLPSLTALWILLPAAVLSGLYIVAASDLRGRGRPGRVAAISLVGLVVNIALNIVLVPALGYVGAAIASLVTYAAQAVAVTAALVSISGVSYRAIVTPSSNDLRLFQAITQQPW